MWKILLILMSLVVLNADDISIKEKELKLEKQKLELQIQQLEIERQQLEIEKEKALIKKEPPEADKYSIQDINQTFSSKSTPSQKNNMYVGAGFVAAGMGSGHREAKITTSTYVLDGGNDFDVDGISLTLGFGKFTENRGEIFHAHRELEFSQVNNTWTIDLFGYDHLFVFNDSSNDRAIPYLKIGAAYVIYDNWDMEIKDSDSTSYSPSDYLSGYGLRLGAGFTYLKNESFEIRGGYDITSISWEKITATDGVDKMTARIEDRIGELFIGLYYRF